MPSFVLSRTPRFDALPPLTQGFIEALFFTETGSGDDGDLRDVGFGDLHPLALKRISLDCQSFENRAGLLLEDLFSMDLESAGRDFLYTRNGHGTGFWGRDDDWYGSSNVRDGLDRIARTFPTLNLYRGNDGLVHVY